MNEQRLQQEPSMEEILASIRRIISEDEASSNRSRAPTGPTMPAEAAPASGARNGGAPTRRQDDASVPTGRPAVSAGLRDDDERAVARRNDTGHALDAAERTPAYRAAEVHDADPYGNATYGSATYGRGAHARDDYEEDTVLDLTEMVAEDGSVVTIAPVSAEDDQYDDTADYDDQGGYDDTLYADPARYDETPEDYATAAAEPGADDYGRDNGHDAGYGRDSALVLEDDRQGGASKVAYAPAGDPAYDTAAAVGYDDDDDGYAEPATAATGPAPATEPRTVAAPRTGVKLNNALAALAGGSDTSAADDDRRENARPHRAPPVGPSVGPSAAPVAAGQKDQQKDHQKDGHDVAPSATPAANVDVRVVGARRAAPPHGDDATPARSAAPAAAPPDAESRAKAARLLEDAPLEDMVREAMKPILREWLDNNLTRLVEDVARQELHRMIESRGGL